MSHRPLIALGTVSLVTVALALVLLSGAGPGEDGAEAVGVADYPDPEELLAQAQTFLDTDRPWRAAMVMRRYAELVPDAPVAARLLAARAEGASGGWPEVRALLEGVPNLDTHANGVGLYLLGRARAAEGDARGAVEAYRAYLALTPPPQEFDVERGVARLHLGLALTQLGERAAARSELQAATARVDGASGWLKLLEADALAQAGDTAAARRAVAAFEGGSLERRAWRVRIEAARQAGDAAGARALAERARSRARSEGARAEFLLASGRLAVEMGDRSTGRAALRGVIALSADGPAAREAAALLTAGPMTAADHLAVARASRAQGLHEAAAAGYQHWLDADDGAPGTREDVHLEHASALFYATRFAEAVEALRPIAGRREARLLMARAEVHRGRTDEAVRLYLALADEQAGTEPGTQALYLAADARHHAGDAENARELFDRVVARYPGSEQAGLARMRLGGLAFRTGDHAGAARHWDQYRSRSPRGPLALQATYWSGRAHAAMGDSAGAAALYRSVRERSRDSYYALLASEALGVAFWPLPMRAAPEAGPAATQRVARAMRGVDLLHAAGFPDEASAEADRVVAAAGGDALTLFALGEALVERGYGQRAIRIGLRLQSTQPPSRRLLRLLYPFPYRTLITAEARERGLDPFVVAALVRQESMFEAGITSPAGARGLMQIMPATGREVADSLGIGEWDAETLYQPEINVHFGTAYVAQQATRFDGSLPAIFSAYNAGPHRMGWWSRYPEFGRDALFTDRIPFRETREYVKILTRNAAVYRGLYGASDG